MRCLGLCLVLITGCRFAPDDGACGDGRSLDEIDSWFWDCDGDNYGGNERQAQFCEAPETAAADLLEDCPNGQWVDNNTDCDDADPARTPADIDGDSVSTCDGDCNDFNQAYSTVEPWYPDCDGDGDSSSAFVESCLMPISAPCEDGESPNGGWTREVIGEFDCDDEDPSRNHTDADQDGFTTCQVNQTDCDDDPLSCGPDCYPGNTSPDLCDGYDNNCNSEVDEDPDIAWFLDSDQDGSSVGTAVLQCDSPGALYTQVGTDTPDCDDEDPAVDALDLDGDGFSTCEGDCNDDDPQTFPGAVDLAENGIDNDCDGVNGVDEDGDGFASTATGGTDCLDSFDDPLSANIHPDADERCDDIDWNCDGQTVPEVPTVTLWAADPSIRTNTDLAAVLDAGELAPTFEGVKACGVIDGWGIRFPSRDFFLEGLGDSSICALGDQPSVDLSSAADGVEPLQYDISNLFFKSQGCPSALDPFLPIIQATGIPEQSTVTLTDVTFNDIDGSGTILELSGFDSEINALSFSNNNVSRLATIDGGVTSIDTLTVQSNTLLDTGIRVENNTDQPTFVFLTGPTSRRNQTTNPAPETSAVFDLQAPASVDHRFYTTPPTLPPSACTGPDGVVIFPPRALRQPDHEANSMQVFRFRNDLDLSGGYFRDNTQAPLFLGTPINETASASISDAYFVGNSGMDTGAVHIYSANNAKSWFTVVNGTLFQQNNSSSSGGAITIDSAGSTVTSGNSFCENTAVEDGGAIMVFAPATTDAPPKSLSSAGDRFELNSAISGGAVALNSAFFVVSSSWFGKNQSTNDTQGVGHAILATGDSVVLATNLQMQQHLPVGIGSAGSHIELNDTSLLNLSRVEYYLEEQSTIDTRLGCYVIPRIEPSLPLSHLLSINCDAMGECVYTDVNNVTSTAENSCR